MTPQVIIVHNIQESINDVGILPYCNTLVQEMSGEYWFVDSEELGPHEECPIPICADYVIYQTPYHGKDGFSSYWKYRVHPVPLKLAHFIIETLRLKAQFGRLGVGDIDEPVKQAVYLLPGTKIFGHEVTELTEIKAELRPVVVERL